MNVEKLLLEVSAISKKYEMINKMTGGYFNIFDIASISTDEVKICRIIYELINPKGSHYQGEKYLKLFVKYVLGLEDKITDEDYETINVYREYTIENDRRIDLVIEGRSIFIPIEVKLYAGDQKNQCHDYYKKAKNSKVYYLTLDGRMPSKESANGLAEVVDKNNCLQGFEEVEQISFRSHILLWLEKCVEVQETIRIASIREILLQFISIIRRLTNQSEGGAEMEIINTISNSSESFKSAIEITNCINKAKTIMLEKVLCELEKRVDVIADKKGFRKENNYYYHKKGFTSSYYNYQKTSYPGINYHCNKITNDIDLWFRIEIDHGIYAGFYAFDNKKNKEFEVNNSLKEQIRKLYPKIKLKIDSCWINFECLPNGNENDNPNFKNHNEAYYNLYDDLKFEAFINDSVKLIEEMIDEQY
jgi:hypothetical protein